MDSFSMPTTSSGEVRVRGESRKDPDGIGRIGNAPPIERRRRETNVIDADYGHCASIRLDKLRKCDNPQQTFDGRFDIYDLTPLGLVGMMKRDSDHLMLQGTSQRRRFQKPRKLVYTGGRTATIVSSNVRH